MNADKCTECHEPFYSRRHSSEFSDEHFWHLFKRDNSPMLTVYDKANVNKILNGEGNWFSAKLLRFLDSVLFSVDKENSLKLWSTYPEHCKLIYQTYGWTEEEINHRLNLAGVINAVN